ncbi:hypothetical protein RI367_002797 [Sorochytrium milnesiophthora]
MLLARRHVLRAACTAASLQRRLRQSSSSAASAAAVDVVAKDADSPLIKHMRDLIRWNGPLSVAQYMRQSLTNPLGGYYMTQRVFGREGDFVTSPEISQMFGELVGVWFLTNYMAAKPAATADGLQLVELGPGRGTLAADIIRTLANYKSALPQGVGAVHLVEASPRLRQEQLDTICGATTVHDKQSRDKHGRLEYTRTSSGLELFWHENIEDIDDGRWTMLVAHEFLDALPVYKFKKTEEGWREIMVDVDESAESPRHFRYVLAPKDTQPLEYVIRQDVASAERYDACSVGTTIEISPESGAYAQRIADRIEKTGGSALIVDYGNDAASEGSLRAIKDHKFVDLFSSPGQCDLSADVDFSYLRAAVGDRAKTFGPTTQRHFLLSLGLQMRLRMLLQGASPEERQLLTTGYNRLIGANEMGTVYKCFAITDKQFPGVPVGFEKRDISSASAGAKGVTE